MAQQLRNVVDWNATLQQQRGCRVPEFMPDDHWHTGFLAQRFESPPNKIRPADNVARVIYEHQMIALRRMAVYCHFAPVPV